MYTFFSLYLRMWTLVTLPGWPRDSAEPTWQRSAREWVVTCNCYSYGCLSSCLSVSQWPIVWCSWERCFMCVRCCACEYCHWSSPHFFCSQCSWALASREKRSGSHCHCFLSSHTHTHPQACKLAIRESIEAEVRRERELRDNPDAEIVSVPPSCLKPL